MSVNDLAERWLKWCKQVPGNSWGLQVKECADDLRNISQTAWHPVSQPPTKEDGDSNGFVLTWDESGEIDMYEWRDLYFPPGAEEIACWARIRDVVLLPEKSF